MRKVYVTGLGVISPLGIGVESNREALAAGRPGIGDVEILKTRYAGSIPLGEVKLTNDRLAKLVGAVEPGCTRTTLLAMVALEEAIRNSALTPDELAMRDTAVVSATTVGGMCMTDELYNDAHSASGGSPYLSAYDEGATAMALRRKYGTRGYTGSINTACSSSANSIMLGARMIRNGQAKRVLAGGADSLAKFTLNGFNALHILSDSPCRPFDKDRSGLNLGEAAAFLVLESEETAGNKKVFAELSGYANVNDAYHASSLSPDGDGPSLAMQSALKLANLAPAGISYINAHGTGTENNDEVESRAMLRVFGTVPPFGSTKAHTGHTLGAAGAIEAVFSILSLMHQEVYPSLNMFHPIPATGLVPVMKYDKQILRHVMSNSFGFGGNCTSLIFSQA
jgi:3-oxoacyl-(acyl-carrier-protein) synthase